MKNRVVWGLVVGLVMALLGGSSQRQAGGRLKQAKRQTVTDEPTTWYSLKVERKLRDRTIIRVFSSDKYGDQSSKSGRIELWSPSGHCMSSLNTHPLENVSFVERGSKPPLLRVTEYSWGTGYQAWVLVYITCDRGKLEPVLSLDGTSHTMTDRDVLTQTLVYDPMNLLDAEWPLIRAVTVEETQSTPDEDSRSSKETDGHVLSRILMESTYRFDAKKWHYRLVTHRQTRRL